MTLLEQLRKPEEVKRWFDQIGDQAANEIESLRQQLVAVNRSKNACVIDLYRRLDLLDDLNLKLQQQLAAMSQELADTKAQLTQESQDSINKQTIIDGLRSERARNEDTLIQLNQKLTTLTTRLAQMEEALKALLVNIDLIGYRDKTGLRLGEAVPQYVRATSLTPATPAGEEEG